MNKKLIEQKTKMMIKIIKTVLKKIHQLIQGSLDALFVSYMHRKPVFLKVKLALANMS